MCRSAIEGRRAARCSQPGRGSSTCGEPELQLLWCLRQEPGDGVDQTTIAQRLAFSPAQVSARVERLRRTGLDRRSGRGRRSAAASVAAVERRAGDCWRNCWRTSTVPEAKPQAARRDGRGWRRRLVLLAAMVSTVGLHAGLLPQAGRRRSELHHRSQVGGRGLARRASFASTSTRVRGCSIRDDPDCPPMPPDDPISHRADELRRLQAGRALLAACAAHAVRRQSELGGVLAAERRGQRRARHAGAVQLALLQSTDYQEQLETLYLSSLDVTFERFRFDTQFFGGSSIFFTRRTAAIARATGSGSSELEVRRSRRQPLRAQKLTTTGGELVVGLANSLVWQFAGTGQTTRPTRCSISAWCSRSCGPAAGRG